MKVSRNELLEVQELTVLYSTESDSVTAVDKVSFGMVSSESVGLVGESGCGKTTLALSILGLLGYNAPVSVSGKVLFRGSNLLEMSEGDLERIRGREIGFAFQEPLLALNPLYTVGFQIAETLKRHTVVPTREVRQRSIDLLRQVDLNPAESAFASYPHQLSGGMRQRAMLAVALSCRPQLLIADEPTSALDAPLKRQILAMLTALCQKEKIGMLLITHDIAYAATFCKRLVAMYKGRLVEDGPVDSMRRKAAHPYSRLLLNTQSETAPKDHPQLSIKSDAEKPVSDYGCNYYARCSRRIAVCATDRPEMQELSPGHHVACWNPVINYGHTENQA